MSAPDETRPKLDDDYSRFAVEDAIMYLSLDRFEPFLPSLDLDAGLIIPVYPALRDFTDGWQAWRHAPGDDEAPVEPELARRLEHMLDAVRSLAGAKAVQQLLAHLRWAVRTENKEDVWQDEWRILLGRLVKHPTPEVLAEHYQIRPDAFDTLVGLAKALKSKLDNIDTQLEATDELPLSGWDEQAYRWYRWESAQLSPLTVAGQHVRRRLFQHTWDDVVDLFTPDEFEALNRWGQAEMIAHFSASRTPSRAHLPFSARVRRP
jgi:hypothetical protein